MSEDSHRAVAELARAFRRAGVPVVRKNRTEEKRTRRLSEIAAVGSPQTSQQERPLYGKPLDSWEPRFRPKEAQKVPEKKTRERIVEPPSEDFEVETRTAVRQKRSKTRNMSLTISVSEEEAQMLRRHAASKDQGFSAWARSVLFRAMGQNLPARPKKY